MQCQESRTILGAYLDGEIELLRSVEFEDHLAACPECSRGLEEQRALHGLLQNPGLRYAAPAGLRESICASLPQSQPEPREQPSGASPWRRLAMPVLRWSAVAVVCMLLAGFLFFRFRGQSDQELAAQVVDNHIRSMMASHLADVASSDQHTVKPWFNGKVSFSPNVADFTAQGFPLAGGRLDYMDNQSVAALVYHRRAHIINVFIYPSTARMDPAQSQRRGYNVIHWAGEGMEYWAVSDLNISELQELVKLLRGLSY